MLTSSQQEQAADAKFARPGKVSVDLRDMQVTAGDMQHRVQADVVDHRHGECNR